MLHETVTNRNSPWCKDTDYPWKYYTVLLFFTFHRIFIIIQPYCSWEILYLWMSRLRIYHKCVKDWLLRWHQWEMAWMKGFFKYRDYIIKFLNIYIWRWSQCFLWAAFHLRHCTEKPAITNQCYQHHPIIVGWEMACAYC